MSTVADNKTALTPEEKKAELARRKAALEARQFQAKNEAKSRLAMARKMSAARSKPGCVTLPAVFISRRPPTARTAAKTASDGQGGAGDKKDPPEVLDVIAIVRGLAAHKAPGLEYEVVSPTCIKIPARNAAALKRARTALKEAVGVDAIAAAKEQLKAAGAIVSWFLIEEGQAASLKTFERQAAQDLLPLFTVQLAAVEAVYSEFVNKDGILVKKTELQCGLPVPLECPFSPKVMLTDLMDLHQLPVQLPDSNVPYPGVMLAYFQNYERSLEDEDEGRGCVVNKIFNNDVRPEDYVYTPQDTKIAPTLKMTYRMGQDQDASNPAFPVDGLFGIQARFIEGGQKDKTKILLRTAFGINNPKDFGAVMSVHSIPAIIAGSISSKDTQAMNPGSDHRKDFGTVCFYGNAIYAELREYLATHCPKVSLGWVMRKLRIKGNPNDESIRFECNDPDYECALNKANTVYDKMARSYTLRAGKVINVGEFNGDIKDTMNRSPTECEFRVLHSQYLTEDQNVAFAAMDTAAAERCLNGADDALIRLDQPLTTIVYMIATFSEEEKAANAKSEVKWLERRKASLAAAAAAAANPPRVNADDDPMEGGSEEEGVQTLVPRVEFTDEQDPDAYLPPVTQTHQDDVVVPDDELMQEALLRQIQDEMDAAAAAGDQGVKRSAPTTVNEAHQEASDAYHDGLDDYEEPEPAPVVATKKKTAPTSKRRVVTGGAARKPYKEEGDFE